MGKERERWRGRVRRGGSERRKIREGGRHVEGNGEEEQKKESGKGRGERWRELKTHTHARDDARMHKQTRQGTSNARPNLAVSTKVIYGKVNDQVCKTSKQGPGFLKYHLNAGFCHACGVSYHLD